MPWFDTPRSVLVEVLVVARADGRALGVPGAVVVVVARAIAGPLLERDEAARSAAPARSDAIGERRDVILPGAYGAAACTLALGLPIFYPARPAAIAWYRLDAGHTPAINAVLSNEWRTAAGGGGAYTEQHLRKHDGAQRYSQQHRYY